jgi:hypothetical protein
MLKFLAFCLHIYKIHSEDSWCRSKDIKLNRINSTSTHGILSLKSIFFERKIPQKEINRLILASVYDSFIPNLLLNHVETLRIST